VIVGGGDGGGIWRPIPLLSYKILPNSPVPGTAPSLLWPIALPTPVLAPVLAPAPVPVLVVASPPYALPGVTNACLFPVAPTPASATGTSPRARVHSIDAIRRTAIIWHLMHERELSQAGLSNRRKRRDVLWPCLRASMSASPRATPPPPPYAPETVTGSGEGADAGVAATTTTRSRVPLPEHRITDKGRRRESHRISRIGSDRGICKPGQTRLPTQRSESKLLRVHGIH
jgi:hypothetical protein